MCDENGSQVIRVRIWGAKTGDIEVHSSKILAMQGRRKIEEYPVADTRIRKYF